MNKQGFVFFYAFMVGVIFFLIGLALAPAIYETISESTHSTQLNCSNSSISQQDQSVCTQMDLMTYLFIGLIFGLGGIVLGSMA